MSTSAPAKQAKPRLHKDVICPFCSLLCDDLTVENNNGQLKVVNPQCQRSKTGFEQIQSDGQCRIQGKPASLEDAIKEAAKILKRAKRPLISGLGTDVDGSRAAMSLAEKSAAYIDHMSSVSALRNYRVLQDHGYMLTTLAEVKNRADLIILAGTDAQKSFSRFFERYVWNEHSMFDLDTSDREIIYIGEGLKTRPGTSPKGKKPISIKCAQENIGEVFGVLNAMVAGTEFSGKVAGVSVKQLQEVVEKIKAASYGTVVWSPSEFAFKHAELTVQSICNFINARNVDSRFAGLSLGGNDGGMTAANVCAWQSGYPLRTRFLNGYPEYDPDNYGTDELLDNNEVDALLWVSAFGSDIPSPKTRLPSIVLADSESAITGKADVFIPVGTTGLDHGGQMIRTDSVVTMTLRATRNTELKSVHDVLQQITELL